MSFDFNKDVSFVLGKVYIKYHFHSQTKPLVFLFSPARTEIPAENVRKNINPWGFLTIKKLGFNVLSLTSLQPRSWYRHPVLRQYLTVQLPEMLPLFPERLGIGADVGGYGLSIYGDALQCQRVLLFNPISTLNRVLAPWENRYPQGARSFSWDKDEFDGAKICCPGYLIYDPQSRPDCLHAQRYAPQLNHINARHMGEKIHNQLQTMKLFQSTLHSFINNELTAGAFHLSLRERRNYFHHYHALLRQNPDQLTPARRNIIENRLLSCARNYAHDPHATRYQNADLLRDIAISLETRDLTLAAHLMAQAHQLRAGPFITKKLNAYRKELSRQTT